MKNKMENKIKKSINKKIHNLEKYLLIMNNYIGLPIELNPIIANFILEKKYIKQNN